MCLKSMSLTDNYNALKWNELTHLHLVPHIYQVSIGSDNGLLPIQRQAII